MVIDEHLFRVPSMKTLDQEHRLLTRLAQAHHLDGQGQLGIARRSVPYAGESKGVPLRTAMVNCEGVVGARLASRVWPSIITVETSMWTLVWGLCPRGRDLVGAAVQLARDLE